MANRRILSLWFPRLAAERWLRRLGADPALPLAVVAEVAQARQLTALSAAASAAGLHRGQPLRDARAMCPALLTRPADPMAEAQFLTALRRWAGQFSPWVAEEPPESLLVDLTGCAHLFGGEAALMARVQQDCAGLGLTMRAAIADTAGAAWALARYGNLPAAPRHGGDAIRQEARATRSRAARRHPLARSGAAAPDIGSAGHIAPPGQTRAALAGLPPAALRLPPETAGQLARLGLRRIDDLLGLPRAALARRFGRAVVQRLDQALGLEPEPISPARAPAHFGVRMTLPDPIGLRDDLLAALDRMLPRLCARLADQGRGARRVRLQAFRADGGTAVAEIGLARPTTDPARLRPLLEMKLDGIDAGFGIDLLRLEAHVTEAVHPQQHRGHLDAAAEAMARQAGAGRKTEAGAGRGAGASMDSVALDDLLGRLGARVGMEAITRLHPADSHIPEKTVQVLAAAWSEPSRDWPAHLPEAAPGAPEVPLRPLLLLRRPEPLRAPDSPRPPARFHWRRRAFDSASATGPERIAPEWWLDDPAWRSGVRDYWRVETRDGLRLWLAYAHGGAVSGGWFCHGVFA